MKKIYRSFDELPLCLSVQDAADVMRLSKPIVYDLANRTDFPAIRVGESARRIVIPRDRFRLWLAGIRPEAVTAELLEAIDNLDRQLQANNEIPPDSTERLIPLQRVR